jgi:Flp pilus assembly protein TadD
LSILVGSLLAQHKFLAAWDEAARLVAIDPTPVALATLGEINLELGRYRAADSLFGSLSVQQNGPAIAPRYARWLELSGRSGAARALLEQARASMVGGFRVPPEQLAWYDLRIGDLAFRNGRGDLADAAYRRGLALHPGDPRLLTALGTLRGGQGRWADALELGGQALTAQFDPATLGLMSRAALALGDSVQADEYARGAAVAVSRQPGAFHRGWALFLLDQGRQVPEILRRAQADLLQRRDVYGFDLTAWALYRSGRFPEAMTLADSALVRGVRDATLHYHAGRIAGALGDRVRAVAESTLAMEISPLAVTLQAPHR